MEFSRFPLKVGNFGDLKTGPFFKFFPNSEILFIKSEAIQAILVLKVKGISIVNYK